MGKARMAFVRLEMRTGRETTDEDEDVGCCLMLDAVISPHVLRRKLLFLSCTAARAAISLLHRGASYNFSFPVSQRKLLFRL